jgi:hypothetical protein
MKSLSKKEKLLLKALGVTLAGCALIVLLADKLPEIGELRSAIAMSEENIGNIQSLQVNETELEENYERLGQAIALEKDRYYYPEERDLTRLGMKMLSLVRRNGLRYTRLNKVDSKDGSHVEIALNGGIVNVMGLLKDIYANPKYLNVVFLSVNNKSGRANVTLRINYGESAPLSP